MTKLIKKVAAMAAAVMMMGTMSIGASASILDIDRNYNGNAHYSACEASLDLVKKSCSAFNLACCLRNGYKEMYADVQINNSKKTLKQSNALKKNPKVGNIITPKITKVASFPGKIAYFNSYMLTKSGAPIEKHRPIKIFLRVQ